MNPIVVFTIVAAVCAMSAEAILDGGTTAAGSIILASGAGVSSLAAVAGGGLLLKALALGGLALATNGGRFKRSVGDNEDVAFAFIAQNEPAQCYRRLICDLASGAMPESENQAILGLFRTETPAVSPKYDFAVAANVGQQLKSAQACEVRYSCPLSGQQIDKLFN